MSLALAAQLLAARLGLDPVGGWGIALPLAGAFLLALALGYRRTTRPVGRNARYALWLLRGAAAAAVVFVMLRPTWLVVGTRQERPLVVLLRDVSRSMQIRDEAPAAPGPPGGDRAVTRADAVTDTLRAQRDLLEKLAEKFTVVGYDFSDRLAPLGDPPPDDPPATERRAVARQVVEALASPLAADGRSTRLGDCLGELNERTLRRRIVGILVLTDGRFNQSSLAAPEAAGLLARRSAPVYPVGFGSPEPTGAVRDSIALGIDARASAFVGNRVVVGGDYRFHGLEGRSVEVRLLVDGRPAGRQVVAVPENLYDQRVAIPWRAEKPGSHKLELEAVPVEGEAVPDNNRIATWIDILAGGLKVLLVQGSPLVEGRFIAGALRQAGEFDVTSVVLVAAGDAARLLPGSADGWARYKGVVLVNVPSGKLSRGQLSSLVEAVGSRGVGLVMTGGDQAFGPGGYGATDLARALPVRIGTADGFAEGPLRLRPTAAGLRERILQIEPEAADVERAWQSLPELAWANRVAGLKTGAEVLAVGGQGDVPLVVAQRYESGNVVALLVGQTWRRQLGGREDPPGQYFKRFWRQLILYLARQDRARGNVWVTTDRPRYSLTELLSGRRRVQVTAGVSDRRGNPVTDAQCELTLSGPGGEARQVPPAVRGDHYTASPEVTGVGDYALVLTAHRGGRPEGEATTRFAVYEPNVEWEQPLADVAAMKDLARRSGGRYTSRAGFAKLLEDLLARDVTDTVEYRRRIDLWDNRYVLVLFAGLLSAEWVLRKRLGLV